MLEVVGLVEVVLVLVLVRMVVLGFADWLLVEVTVTVGFVDVLVTVVKLAELL